MSRKVARPYAQALFAVVKPQGEEALKRAGAALVEVASLFSALPELLRAFELPSLAQRRKVTLLRDLSKRLGLPVEVERLLLVMQAHYRLRVLASVVEEFQRNCDQFFGVTRGKVATPTSLSKEKLKALAGVLRGVVGGEVVLEQEVKEELLAGFVIRLGSLVFDGSLKRHLERFAGSPLPEGGHHAS
ncbi:MAG: ATP synthase F1 subunit delta [Thermoanaerobaculaceae bacterium]